MAEHRYHEHGFSIVEIFLGLLAIIILGAVGWFGYNNFIKHTSTSESNVIDSAYEKPDNWQTYSDSDIPFIFDYPSNWTLNKQKEESGTVLTAIVNQNSSREQILSIAYRKLGGLSIGVSACQIKSETNSEACSYIKNEFIGYFYHLNSGDTWSGSLTSDNRIYITLIKQDKPSKDALIELAKSVRKPS